MSVPVELVQEAKIFPASPDARQGQSLFWGEALGTDDCVQGVTELTECVRCDDAWLRSVQEEMRAGSMSVDTHALLHGRPSGAPGAYIRDNPDWDARCVGPCKELYERTRALPRPEREAEVHKHECATCKSERGSRRLVATGPEDPRFSAEAFRTAPCIFVSNSVKYDVNKCVRRSTPPKQARV